MELRYLESPESQTGEISLNVTCTKSVKVEGGEVPPRTAYTEPGERDRTGPGVEGSGLYRAEVVRKVTQPQPTDFIIKCSVLIQLELNSYLCGCRNK